MKKEIVVAILLGLTLGLIVSVGVYRARKSLQSQTTNQPIPSSSPTPDTTGKGPLVIISPEDESIQSTKELKITGTTKPEALIVIMVNDTPFVTTADKSGNFSIQTELKTMANIIVVRAIDEDGNTTEEKRSVIYTTTALDEAPNATFSAVPTPTPKPKTTIKVTPKPSATPTASPKAT